MLSRCWWVLMLPSGCFYIGSDHADWRKDRDSDGVPWTTDCDDEDPGLGECPDGVVGAIGLGLIPIAPGSFTMGCTAGQGQECDQDEAPYEVTLSRAFWLGETEVTQGQFLELMGYNPSHFDSCGPDCPVELVDWHEAAAFANAVSTAEGLDPCYVCGGSGAAVECLPVGEPHDCAGYRMPTEAEWEYAARCGSDSRYAGSDDIGAVAWYVGNSAGQTHAVGQLSPNDCGLYDMSGNVWEWAWDWYGDYPSGPSVDPVGPQSGSYRVLRGGSWDDFARYTRLAFRDAYTADYHSRYHGFRLARSNP